MKKNLLNLLLLVIIAVFVGSCKDDEAPPGSFTIDGTKHTLTKGYAEYQWSYVEGEDTYYNWVAALSSSGISYNETDEEFSGIGDVILFFLAIPNNDSEELPTGTYTFPSDSGDPYIDDIWVALSLDADSEDEPDFAVNPEDLTEGEVTITKSGSTYTITFSLDFDGEVVSGTYKGTIKPVAFNFDL